MSAENSETPKKGSSKKWTVWLFVFYNGEDRKFKHCTKLFNNFGVVSFKTENGEQVVARCNFLAMEEPLEKKT